MAQTRSNAKRSAEAATKRTGIDHQIREVPGGWEAYVPTLREEPQGTTQTGINDFIREVAASLALEQLLEDVLEGADVRVMLEDGYKNGRAANLVASDIMEWLQQNDEPDDDDDVGQTEACDAAEDAAEDPADEALLADDALLVEATAPAPTGKNLRAAAQAVVDAWFDEANRETDIISALDGPMDALRDALAEMARVSARKPATPRAGTKQDAVLAMLRATGGATVPEIGEATDWQAHTVRGFLAGLKKKGMTVTATKTERGNQKIMVYTIEA